jgi:hypothetical protein
MSKLGGGKISEQLTVNNEQCPSGDKMDKWRSAPIKAASQPIKSFYLFYHFYPFYLFYRRGAPFIAAQRPGAKVGKNFEITKLVIND